MKCATCKLRPWKYLAIRNERWRKRRWLEFDLMTALQHLLYVHNCSHLHYLATCYILVFVLLLKTPRSSLKFYISLEEFKAFVFVHVQRTLSATVAS